MGFLNQLCNINTRLKSRFFRYTLIFLSSINLPSVSLAQLPRFDSELPQKSPTEETPSSPVSPSNNVPTQPSQPSEQPIFNGSTAPLPEARQAPIGIIKPVNGLVNIKLTNKTAAAISYEVIGDTTQRRLSGKSEIILKTLKVPVNITFYREKGGFLLIQPQFINDQGLLELNMTETNDFNLDKSSLLIEETGSVFLN